MTFETEVNFWHIRNAITCKKNETSQVTLVTAHSPEIFSKNLRDCGLTDYVNSYGIGSSGS